MIHPEQSDAATKRQADSSPRFAEIQRNGKRFRLSFECLISNGLAWARDQNGERWKVSEKIFEKSD